MGQFFLLCSLTCLVIGIGNRQGLLLLQVHIQQAQQHNDVAAIDQPLENGLVNEDTDLCCSFAADEEGSQESEKHQTTDEQGDENAPAIDDIQNFCYSS